MNRRLMTICASFYLGTVLIFTGFAMGEDESKHPAQHETILETHERVSLSIAASNHPEAKALQSRLDAAYGEAIECLTTAPDSREAKKCQMNFEFDAKRIESILRGENS